MILICGFIDDFNYVNKMKAVIINSDLGSRMGVITYEHPQLHDGNLV